MIDPRGRLSKGDPVEQTLTGVLLAGLTSSVRRCCIRVFLLSDFCSSSHEHLSERLVIGRQLPQAEEFAFPLGDSIQAGPRDMASVREKDSKIGQCKVELEFLKREFKARVKRKKLGVEGGGRGDLSCELPKSTRLQIYDLVTLYISLPMEFLQGLFIYFFNREHRTSR